LPIDPSYLSWRVKQSLGRSFRFVELANDVNEHMPHYVVARLVEALNRRQRAVNGSSILLVGLAYKKNTGDARESPAIAIAARLLELGAVVRAVDPFVAGGQVDEGVQRVEFTPDELRSADAVVLVTDHDRFDLGVLADNATYVLDTRHRMPALPNIEYL
jgi:UDP-N-acetyl-D-glucosamine dehydrogenase